MIWSSGHFYTLLLEVFSGEASLSSFGLILRYKMCMPFDSAILLLGIHQEFSGAQ